MNQTYKRMEQFPTNATTPSSIVTANNNGKVNTASINRRNKITASQNTVGKKEVELLTTSSRL